jgi:hypothetical protein
LSDKKMPARKTVLNVIEASKLGCTGFLPQTPGGIMEIVPERRHDDESRAVIDQAIEFKKTLGQNVDVSFLVEHYVPPPLLQRVLMSRRGVFEVDAR